MNNAEKIVRELADIGLPWQEGDYGAYCFFCCADYYDPHKEDCLYIQARKYFNYPLPECVAGTRPKLTGRLVIRGSQ